MNQIICIALALVVGLLSSRLMKLIKLPNVTGYLLAGIIFGPFCLGQFFGWNHDPNIGPTVQEISWISDIALGFIAFSIGSSFKVGALKSVGPKIILITIFEALGGCFIVMLSLFILKVFIDIPTPIILTLSSIACATAPAATLMVIKQYKARGPVVSTLLPVVAFDDAVALIMFAILFSISKSMISGTEVSFLDVCVWPLISILSSILIGGLLGFLVSIGCKLFQSRANRMTMCIAAILICVGISKLPLSDWFKFDFSFSSLLACMMIGAIFINMRTDSPRVFERMEIFTHPIFMLFFVISGASLDLTIFVEDYALIAIGIAGIYIIFRALGKWIGAFSSSKITKAEPTVQKYLGFTLIPQAGVAIGLATTSSQTLLKLAESSTGETLDAIMAYGKIILAVILVATIIYELIGPIVTKIALTKAGEIEKSVKQVQ